MKRYIVESTTLNGFQCKREVDTYELAKRYAGYAIDSGCTSVVIKEMDGNEKIDTIKIK